MGLRNVRIGRVELGLGRGIRIGVEGQKWGWGVSGLGWGRWNWGFGECQDWGKGPPDPRFPPARAGARRGRCWSIGPCWAPWSAWWPCWPRAAAGDGEGVPTNTPHPPQSFGEPPVPGTQSLGTPPVPRNTPRCLGPLIPGVTPSVPSWDRPSPVLGTLDPQDTLWIPGTPLCLGHPCSPWGTPSLCVPPVLPSVPQ